MPKGVRRHVGPVGVPRPSLGRALPLIPAPRLSEPARASAVWRPRGSHPAGVGGRRPLPWAEALRRRAGRELVTALRSQFGADQYGRLRETSKRQPFSSAFPGAPNPGPGFRCPELFCETNVR